MQNSNSSGNEDVLNDNDELNQEDSQEEEFSYEDEGEDGKEVIKKLREKLKKAEADKAEYLAGWQRAKADSLNLSKSSREEMIKTQSRVEEGVMMDLLPVLDSFSMAMGNKEVWEKGDPQWRTGVEYIHSQLLKVLGEYGVEELDIRPGDRIDLQVHYPISVIESDLEGKNDTVARVIQKGYKSKNGVLRPATVEAYKYSPKG